jgi:GR25 family glycosyltransferase involved in LPS biosynthesis
MRKHKLPLNASIYSGISDAPIGCRGELPMGQWKLTSPELGCFMSHYRIWCESMESRQNVLVLEHDCLLVSPVPKLEPGVLAAILDTREYPGTAGYVLTPEAASLAVSEAKNNGVQPSDELLWRSALRNEKLLIPERPVVVIRDGGVSTIQWTRTDVQDKKVIKNNPWKDFRKP